MTFSSWHDHNPWTHGGIHAHAAGGGGFGYSHGGGFGYSQGFGGWMSHSMMGRSVGGSRGMWGGERGLDYSRGHPHGQSYGHSYGRQSGPDGNHYFHAPAQGGWNTDKGGFVVGRDGKLDVDFKGGSAGFNNNVQYRIGEGDWQTLARSKDAAGTTATINATPGANVQFRIQTPEGNNFQAGTTRNSDGLDHARIGSTGNGVEIGFEDLKGGGDKDFNDVLIDVYDPRRRQAA